MASPSQARNTHIEQLNRIVLIAFFVVGGGLLFWSVLRAGWLLAREDNPRLVAEALQVRRGTIFDVDGAVLAQSAGQNQVTRTYDSASGALVGYYSFQYGTAGIEAQFDDVLQGERSFVAQQLLHRPQVGRSVRLTLKRDWQAAVIDRLDGRGAAVLLSVPDFAVRALVSSPTYDPNLLDQQFETLVADEASGMLLNRALEGYQPGGVLVPFWSAAGAETGQLEMTAAPTLDGAINQLTPNVTALCDWSVRWGFLQPAQLAGAADPVPCAMTVAADGLIGQDEQTVQPLQVARAWAGLVNGGVWQPVQTVAAVERPDGWQVVLNEGAMVQAVSADAAAQVLDLLERDGSIVDYGALALAGPNALNAWYMGAIPAENPQFVLVLVLEESDVAAVQAMGRALLRDVMQGE